MRGFREPILLLSLGLFAVIAASPEIAHGAQSHPVSSAKAAQPMTMAKSLIEKAKALIADAIPEERSLAEQSLIEATRVCSTCSEAYAELGRLWLTDYTLGRAGLGALQRAAAMAEITKELEPESPLGDYLGVEILLTIGRQAEAFRLYAGAKQAYEQHVETDAFEARLWAEVDPEKALVAAQSAISKGYPLQELAPWIGNALIRLSKEENSGDALQKFAEVYPDRWLWHRAAMAYAGQKKWAAAKQAFERAIALGNTLESPLQLAILEYKEMNNPKAGAQRLMQLLKLVDKNKSLNPDSRALVEAHAAFAHLAADDKNAARTHAEKALELSVSNDARVTQIIETFRDGKQLPLIADALQRVALRNPLLEETHLALAMISSEAKDYSSTVEHLSAAIALSPERDDLYSARGQASYLATKYETALQDFETAIRQKPEHAAYHYNKACLLSLLGRKSEAFESLKTAVVMSESLRDQASSDGDLENLRKDKEFEERLSQLGILTQRMNEKSSTVSTSGGGIPAAATPLQRTRPGKPD